MAQKVTVTLEDDLDGGTADQTLFWPRLGRHFAGCISSRRHAEIWLCYGRGETRRKRGSATVSAMSAARLPSTVRTAPISVYASRTG